jgi:Ni/Co efflux regulator RcnB
MNKTVLALTTALLLAGGAATTASAQTTYYYDNGTVVVDNDADRDGVPDRYDRYDNRPNGSRFMSVARDRDCDGVPDRYDSYVRDAYDADCDGIPDRFDRYYNRVYTSPQRYYGPRYIEPYGYRHSRWSVGSYLPSGYYGDSYYIDYEPYGLTPPPYGYRWNRVGNDVYLVSIDSGLIAEVVYDLFH